MGRLGSSRAIAPALIAALLCAPAAPIMAQPKAGAPAPAPPAPAPPSQAQMTQAKDLVNKAITKSQQGDHQTAIELYLQAYDIAPLSLLLSNIGSEYQQANKPVEALKYFCKYLEVEPTGPNASYATAQAKVLQSSLHNAVDDGNVCKPLPAISPSPPEGSGSAAPGLGSAAVVASVTTPEDPGHGMRVAGIGVGAAGVALAVVGVIFGSKAASISNSITNHPVSQPWPDDIQAQESEGQADQTKQIAFLVAGGAAVGVGVALYMIGRGKKAGGAEEHALVVPTAAPGYGGVALTGRW